MSVIDSTETTETAETAETSDGAIAPRPTPPAQLEVRRNAAVAALLGVASAGLAIAYLARAVSTGAVLDWTLVAVLAVLAGVWLRAFVDARTPLLVADAHGVRLRLGHTWRGVPWTEVREVVLHPRRGLLRDGRLSVSPYDEDRVLADLDPAGRRQARWSTRLYGAPLAVPLGLTTRVVGGTLPEDLRGLAGVGIEVVDTSLVADDEDVEPAQALDRAEALQDSVAETTVVVDPVEAPADAADATVVADDDAHDDAGDETGDETGERHRLRFDPRPRLAASIGAVAGWVHLPHRRERSAEDEEIWDLEDVEATDEPPVQDRRAEAPQGQDRPVDTEPLTVIPRPEPVRDLRTGRRSEVTSRVAPRVQPPDDEVGEPSRALPGEVDDVVEELPTRPVADPVIGPQLAVARRRLALGVDQLAERTRIRPHVIEAIEVDDFGPCGGDFYARGHLRTLARVLGVEAAPLLVDYDERYADAPIDPRRVFEAELASTSLRGSTAGPNWTLLVGAFMALVLAWSVARLFLDQPEEIRGQAPVFQPAVTQAPATLIGEPVTVGVTASRPTHVVVRNAEGRAVFTVDLLADQTRTVRVVPPVRVTASHGDAVTVSVAGEDQGVVGDTIRQTSRRFTVG